MWYSFAEIHADAPEFVEMSVEQEILETGIKVVDMLAPYCKGGKIGENLNCVQLRFLYGRHLLVGALYQSPSLMLHQVWLYSNNASGILKCTICYCISMGTVVALHWVLC